MSNDTLSTLYSEHHSWLRGWLRKKVGCSYQAADLAQDTFLRVIQLRQKQGSLPEIKEPRAYLSSIAHNIVVDVFRCRSVEKAYLEALALQPESITISVENSHNIIETLLEIDRLLDNLGERGRTIFLMAQIEGLSYVEIGRRLKLSVNTVRKYFIRAMTQCLILVDEQ